MLYAFLKFIFKVALWVFFRRFDIRNRQMLQQEGPLLVVSNHPNTFMDPIIIASLLEQEVYFIAKSTVFDSPLKKWLLHRMNLIPIHRREDAPEQVVSNTEAFKASYTALANRQTILIFPEGTSFNERRLRKLKTGTARIALGAEANASDKLGLRILPIGLNYSSPTHFRSDVFVNVGEPIPVSEYLHAFHENTTAATQALTDKITLQLEKLIIVTPSEEEDELVRHIEEIYKSNLISDAPSAVTEYEQNFILTKAIVKSLNFFKQSSPERVSSLEEHIKAYMQQLKRLRLHDALLGKGNKRLLTQSIKLTLFVCIGFPLYLFGLLNNYVPYIIPSKIAHILSNEKEWHAPIMLTVGIFTFPAFYTLQAILFWQLFPEVSYLLLYLISLPLFGFFTLRYWNIVKNVQDNWIMLRLFFKRKDEVEHLKQQRKAIIEELEQARADYMLQ